MLLLLLLYSCAPLLAEATFASLASAPDDFVALINQHRLANCPHLPPYDGGALTGTAPITFSRDGAPLRALVEVRLFDASRRTRSKVYRAEAAVVAGGGALREDTLLPPPCEDALDLGVTFSGDETRAPWWLADAGALRMTRQVTLDADGSEIPDALLGPRGRGKTAPARRPDKTDADDDGAGDAPAAAGASSAAPGAAGFKASAETRVRGLRAIRPQRGASGQNKLRQSTSSAAVVFDGITLPLHYNAMDTYLGATPCKAFRPMHQGITNGCAVYTSTAVTGARMCLQNDRESSIDNVVFSPRQNGDCGAKGWFTRSSVDTYAWQATSPPQMVEEWCAPFNSTGEAPCTNGICTEGMRYGIAPGSAYTVYGIPAVMAEILKNGPVGARVFATSDFINKYSGGVFSHPFNPLEGIPHKVSLIGWGATPEGVPYWTIQNSWGSGWGEGGYGRILRGANVMNIEAEGFNVVKTISSAPNCAGRPTCHVWSRTLADCSCACNGTLRSGAQCEVCPADACLNGGEMLDPACARCACPHGYFGRRCEFAVALQTRRWAVCQPTTAGQLSMGYQFSSDPASPFAPPLGQSTVSLYPENQTDKLAGAAATALVCGSTPLSQRCPVAGALTLPSAPPGAYKAFLMRAQNNKGTLEFYAPTHSANLYLGALQVLAATHPACQGTPDAAAQLDALASQRAPIAAAIDAEAARAAASAARLAAAQPAIDQIRAQWALTDVVPALPISIAPDVLSSFPPALRQQLIDDILPPLNSSAPPPVLWASSVNLYSVCPVVPPQLNGIRKALTLTTGDGTVMYNNSLGPNANTARWIDSTDIGKCSEIRLNTANNADAFNVGLYNFDRWGDPNFVLFRRFKSKRITFTTAPWISGRTTTTVTIKTTFVYISAPPMLLDTLKVYDKTGTVVHTTYTYCRCVTAPSEGSVPANMGTKYETVITLPRLPTGTTNGPYQFRIQRANTAAVVALAAPNINWALAGL